MKRAAVRRISSTYAYDFLGLFEVSLVQRWGAYLRDESALDSIPADVFDAKEILLGADGSLLRSATLEMNDASWVLKRFGGAER